MNLHFNVKYSSLPGEPVFVSISGKNKRDRKIQFPLEYKDSMYWQGNIGLAAEGYKQISYTLIIKRPVPATDKILITRKIRLKKYRVRDLHIFCENTGPVPFAAVMHSKPFSNIFRQKNIKKAKKRQAKKPTHIFKAELPRLQDHIFLCLTGSANNTGSFDPQHPVLFRKKKNGSCSLAIDFSKEDFPVEYKFAFYDALQKKIISYEPGANRSIDSAPDKKVLNVIYPALLSDAFLWKGAGLNIPVFSLRSETSWGIGDFGDIHLLADWAEAAGLKLIQLLPINDTIATLTDGDSYPYSAISAFALHPQFLNVQQIAKNIDVIVSDGERAEIKRLNELAVVDYAAVLKLKLTLLKRCFEKAKHDFRDDMDWFSFFELNREWLVSYAVFCTLRDQYGTTDYSKWPDHRIYCEESIQERAAPGTQHYEAVLFYYYLQYQLHLQLKDAVDHAHKKRLILKADLPIGVGRFSADTWKRPGLFHLDMQAGAPPDAFSDRGQNWGFPTYNFQQMEAENFSWFRRRMEHAENYFDALRIDHVLGFFRIWRIPAGQSDARLGRFVPAIPMTAADFITAGIQFDEHRLCDPSGDDAADLILIRDELPGKYHFRINMHQTNSFGHCSADEQQILGRMYDHYFYGLQNDLWKEEGEKKLKMLKNSTRMLLCAEDLGMVPDFTDEVLHALDMLSLQVLQMAKEKGSDFSDTDSANYESVVMPATHDMPPMRLWWEQNHGAVQYFLNDILKISGTAPYFCEPWVCKKIFEMHLRSPAMWSIFLLQDILAVNGSIRRPQPAEERINDPANAKQVWNYRMHITLEQLINKTEFNHELKTLIKTNER